MLLNVPSLLESDLWVEERRWVEGRRKESNAVDKEDPETEAKIYTLLLLGLCIFKESTNGWAIQNAFF